MGRQYMKSDLIPSINFPFETFQPVLDGYRNKCEFTIAEGPDGGRTLLACLVSTCSFRNLLHVKCPF